MQLPKFLIIRFAPGAAGNLLASILQCSPEIAHWNVVQQSQKPNNNWIDYFQQIFPAELGRWLYHEPIGQLNWGTRKIFSAKYPRGNNLSIDNFLKQEQIHCNDYYHQQKNSNQYLPIFWHKQHMPEYFSNSKSITIQLDKESVRWFDRAVYHKHYSVKKTDAPLVKVKLLENRTEIVLPEFKDSVDFEKTYNSFRQFVEKHIHSNPFKKQFLEENLVSSWSIPNKTINLSTILESNKFVICYYDLCEFLNITPVLPPHEVYQLQDYWRRLHDF